MSKTALDNRYPCKGWQVDINNWDAWSFFRMAGFYEPSNENSSKEFRK